MGGKFGDGDRRSLSEALVVFSDRLVKASPLPLFLAGSARRGLATVGDLDVVALVSDEADVVTLASAFSAVGDVLGGAYTKSGRVRSSLTLVVDGMQVDVLCTDAPSLPAAMMHLTGPCQTNVAQRSSAKRQGLLLNEKGLFKPANGSVPDLVTKSGSWVRVPVESEQEIYQVLGLEWLEPEER